MEEVSRVRKQKKVKKQTKKLETYKQQQRDQCIHPNVQYGYCLKCGQEVA